jgi:hypothetical protein
MLEEGVLGDDNHRGAEQVQAVCSALRDASQWKQRRGSRITKDNG